MIALLAAAASGQDMFDDPRNECSADDAEPIVGASGFTNTLAALRTNAATYSASNFAEKHGLRRMALDPETKGVVLGEANIAFGVTQVPVFQTDAMTGSCPAEFVLAKRAVDIYAYNLGFAGRWGPIGAFYASSVTLGYPAELTYLRMYQTFGTLMTAPFMTGLMPLVGSWQTESGASAYAQDFVAGVIVDAEVAHLRGGYTQSRGWYLSGQDKYLGLFGSVVLRDGLQLVGQFRGGLERVKVPGSSKVGRPSAFARILPLTEEGDQGDGETGQIDLTTGHLEHEGLMGVLDLRGAYAIKPVAQLHEASIALHDPTWYATEDGEDPAVDQHVYGEAGFVTTPTQYYYGMPGGTYLHLRGEYQQTLYAEGEPLGAVHVIVMFNDPEQTALYPFSVNTLSIRAQVKAGF